MFASEEPANCCSLQRSQVPRTRSDSCIASEVVTCAACDIEDMENGMEFHLQIKTMRFINQYGVRFKYRARLDTLRAKSGSEINIRLCCFHTFKMSVHLSIYRLKMHHNGCIVEGGEDLLGVWTKARQNISPRTSPGLCITHK